MKHNLTFPKNGNISLFIRRNDNAGFHSTGTFLINGISYEVFGDMEFKAGKWSHKAESVRLRRQDWIQKGLSSSEGTRGAYNFVFGTILPQIISWLESHPEALKEAQKEYLQKQIEDKKAEIISLNETISCIECQIDALNAELSTL